MTFLFARKLRADSERAARYFHVCQAVSLRVTRDLEHPCAEVGGRFGLLRAAVERIKKRLHAVESERRAEKARERLSLTDKAHDVRLRHGSHLEIPFEQRLVADRQLLVQGLFVPEIDNAGRKPLFQLTQQQHALRAVQIHLVDEQEGRDIVPRKQPPERFRVRLHAVRAADDEHRVVEHLKRALHLGRKVHVTRRVEQRHPGVRQRKLRLLGENRDAALAFKGKRIEKGVPVIDTPQLFERTRLIEHRFGKRRLSGIYVRRYTNTNMFHRFFAFVISNLCPQRVKAIPHNWTRAICE